MSSKNILVVLSGCGLYDGAEIHESVITLLAIARAGATYTIAAPDKDQMHVINHATHVSTPEPSVGAKIHPTVKGRSLPKPRDNCSAPAWRPKICASPSNSRSR